MSGARCEIRVDLSGIEKRFSEAALREKQEAFAERVAFEMRDYVPVDSGALQGSEPLASDYGSGTIEWNTPYAKYVVEMPESSIKKTKNPKARANWPEAAKSERMDAWEDFAKRLMEER